MLESPQQFERQVEIPGLPEDGKEDMKQIDVEIVIPEIAIGISKEMILARLLGQESPVKDVKCVLGEGPDKEMIFVIGPGNFYVEQFKRGDECQHQRLLDEAGYARSQRFSAHGGAWLVIQDGEALIQRSSQMLGPIKDLPADAEVEIDGVTYPLKTSR